MKQREISSVAPRSNSRYFLTPPLGPAHGRRRSSSSSSSAGAESYCRTDAVRLPPAPSPLTFITRTTSGVSWIEPRSFLALHSEVPESTADLRSFPRTTSPSPIRQPRLVTQQEISSVAPRSNSRYFLTPPLGPAHGNSRSSSWHNAASFVSDSSTIDLPVVLTVLSTNNPTLILWIRKEINQACCCM